MNEWKKNSQWLAIKEKGIVFIFFYLRTHLLDYEWPIDWSLERFTYFICEYFQGWFFILIVWARVCLVKEREKGKFLSQWKEVSELVSSYCFSLVKFWWSVSLTHWIVYGVDRSIGCIWRILGEILGVITLYYYTYYYIWRYFLHYLVEPLLCDMMVPYDHYMITGHIALFPNVGLPY